MPRYFQNYSWVLLHRREFDSGLGPIPWRLVNSILVKDYEIFYLVYEDFTYNIES